MMRLLLLPLFLFTLSMACMGQTFQYSRGWTNGKRAPLSGPLLSSGHFQRGDEQLANLYDFQENERKLERCLVQLQRFVGSNLHRSYAGALAYNANKPDIGSLNAPARPSANNNNNDNSLYASPHHQSSELYEELNAAAAAAAEAGGPPSEPNDYNKH
ncbi:pro-corazonin [Scaptodrosophila lebanonensis]|uniref:Pro-corazonin n=1 Tax=Drosophila lebanonensis TaxID=7225 RepID=A0A6J2TD56_DROLE|nr:pro-corazonin [Scaptodrosophila lebanonensis]